MHKAASKGEVHQDRRRYDTPKDVSGLKDRLSDTLIDVYLHSIACQISLVCWRSRNPDILKRAYRSLKWENCGVVCTENLQVPGLC